MLIIKISNNKIIDMKIIIIILIRDKARERKLLPVTVRTLKIST